MRKGIIALAVAAAIGSSITWYEDKDKDKDGDQFVQLGPRPRCLYGPERVKRNSSALEGRAHDRVTTSPWRSHPCFPKRKTSKRVSNRRSRTMHLYWIWNWSAARKTPHDQHSATPLAGSTPFAGGDAR